MTDKVAITVSYMVKMVKMMIASPDMVLLLRGKFGLCGRRASDWPPRRLRPVRRGRMIVHIAAAFEMGSESVWMLCKEILRGSD